MPTLNSKAMALKETTTLPSIGSLLVSTGSGVKECGLCGNSFEIGESSESSPIELPCVDPNCGPCATMWRMLNSPTCRACYADFTCPKSARDGAKISFQDMYLAFYCANADSDDDTISDPGSPMKEDNDGARAVSQFGVEDLQEALNVANNRADTNFNIQEIEDEIPLAVLRTGTETQLVDAVTQICVQKAEESDEDDAKGESSHETDGDDLSDATVDENGDIVHRCTSCQKVFGSSGHLRQHMVVHSLERRTCSLCGRVLGNPSSRRVHEQRHRETDLQREERLHKMRTAKNRVKGGRKGNKQGRRQRIPEILG